MVGIEVLVERVEGARLSDKASESSPSSYSLNVSMSEKDRTSESLVLNFSLELTSQPQLARLLVTGTATVSGSKDEIQGVTKTPDDNNPPVILLTIYERVYGLLYLVSTSLKVPHPMPTLLRTGGPEAET
jgi:hypothetical protein